jgi:hypothetical protein
MHLCVRNVLLSRAVCYLSYLKLFEMKVTGPEGSLAFLLWFELKFCSFLTTRLINSEGRL